MMKIAVLVCLATLAVAHESLFPSKDSLLEYDEELALTQLFPHIRSRRDTDDENTDNAVDIMTDNGNVEDGGPPPGEGGPPPGEGGPPPGEGGPPPGEGGPPPGEGGPPPGEGGPPPGEGGPPHGRPGGRGGPRRRKFGCCNFPRQKSKELREVMMECFHKNRPEPPKGGPGGRRCPRKPDGCVMECIYRNQSMLTSDDKVDLNKIQERLNNMVENDTKAVEWKELLKKSLDSCSDATQLNVTVDQKCQSGAQELAWCFNKQVIMGCPDFAWNSNNTRCENMRAYFKNPEKFPSRPNRPECNSNATNANAQ